MKASLKSSLFAACLLASSLGHAVVSTPPSAATVGAEIRDMEWTLRNSSLAGSVTGPAGERAQELLARAREELANGHLNTARELARRAARPLMEMEGSEAKHPDRREAVVNMKMALAALVDAARPIASEKGEPLAALDAAEHALDEGEALLRAGRYEEAQRKLSAAYATVQEKIARMRAGEHLVLGLPTDLDASERWADSMRRYEERETLTELMIEEARQTGIEAAPLVAGLRAAQANLAEATALAQGNRWTEAHAAMALAFLRFEDSWKQVGVEF